MGLRTSVNRAGQDARANTGRLWFVVLLTLVVVTLTVFGCNSGSAWQRIEFNPCEYMWGKPAL